MMRLPHSIDLFRRTRWRLAVWYASVMGLILTLSGLGIYETIAHAHRVTADRELRSVAATLQNSLQLTLKQPGNLESASQQVLPDLCFENRFEKRVTTGLEKRVASQPMGKRCIPQTSLNKQNPFSRTNHNSYYIRLFNRSGDLVAQTASLPPGLPFADPEEGWHSLKDSHGNRYRQISLSLYTHNNLPWGSLQMGRSLQDFDRYLASVRLVMVLCLPVAILAIGAAGWWLAGLAMKPIHQSYQQIQQFTADAAHELRTPLAAILATVEATLRLQHLPESEARETLQVVERQNQRLAQLVNDLLLLSRLDRQLCSGPNRLCCLQDLLSDLEEELAALAIAHQIALKLACPSQVPIQIRGEEEQLYRLLFNIVANAIQYTPAGGRVSVRLKDNGDRATIQIQDTGIGIDPKHQARIFDRFYRINDDRSRDTGGSGLGLAIASAIAQAHQGSIQVQSQVGQGSCFIIQLPKSQ